MPFMMPFSVDTGDGQALPGLYWPGTGAGRLLRFSATTSQRPQGVAASRQPGYGLFFRLALGYRLGA